MSKTKTIYSSIVLLCLLAAILAFSRIDRLNVSHAETLGKSNLQASQNLVQSPATAGVLDPSFGTGGETVVNISPNGGTNPPIDVANAVAIQSDGKIVAGGYSRPGNNGQSNPPLEQFALVRLNTDGTPDTSFDGDGIVTTQVSTATNAASSRIFGIAIQPDGKIIAAGVAFVDSPFPANRFALARYNTNGSLDTSFGTGGKVLTQIGLILDIGSAVVLQPDGKIVLAGYGQALPGQFDFELVRYNTNGSLDTTFGTGGKVATDFGTPDDECYSLAIQPDGKLIAGGFVTVQAGNLDYGLARYNTNGSLDTSFGTGGKVIADGDGAGDVALTVIVQPDGKIIASGGVPNFALARFNSDGSYDTGFGTSGKSRVQMAGGAENNVSILQLDGKIILGGAWGPWFTMVRFTSNGLQDTSFGDQGLSTAQFPPGQFPADGAIIHALALQQDGKIIAAGQSGDGNPVHTPFAFARYFNDVTNNSSVTHRTADFDGDGKTDLSVFRPSDSNWYIMQSTTNSLSVLKWGLSTDIPVSGDFDGDGKTDAAIVRTAGSRLEWYIFQSSNLTSRAQVFGTTGDKPVVGDYDGDGKADIAIFRPSTGDWWIMRSSDNQTVTVHWGQSGDVPTPADFDGDGKTDISVWRPGAGNGASFWYTLQSSNNTQFYTQFGLGSDRPVPADYDGDGKTNYAVFRPSNGTWYTSLDPATNYGAQIWGISTDVCVPGDYDGDGKTDIAIYRNGVWYIKLSSSSPQYASFGLSSDTPIPFSATPQP